MGLALAMLIASQDALEKYDKADLWYLSQAFREQRDILRVDVLTLRQQLALTSSVAMQAKQEAIACHEIPHRKRSALEVVLYALAGAVLITAGGVLF